MRSRKASGVGLIVALALTVGLGGRALAGSNGSSSHVQWVNHFDLQSGDPSVTQTSSLSTNSGVGGGLTGLVITSTTPGNVDSFGGDKVVQMALQLQPQTRISRVVVCYELTSANSFIDQIRLAQVQNPPAVALVRLDDATPLTNVGPVCVASVGTSIKPSNGSVLLSLRVNFAAGAAGGPPTDKIVVRALGLLVQ
ncbi:MAG: hypothetical protein ACRETH_00525 [Steroidobacteraceae bacterium]